MPAMPEVRARYMLVYLLEIGPMMAGSAVSQQEIAAWQSNTGIALDAWESRFLRALSSEYASELIRAEAPARVSPWERTRLVMVANSLKDSIMGLTKL